MKVEIKMNRRKFLTGLVFVAAAPAIVRVGSIMPVKAPRIYIPPADLSEAAIDALADECMRSVAPGNWIAINAFWRQKFMQQSYLVTFE